MVISFGGPRRTSHRPARARNSKENQNISLRNTVTQAKWMIGICVFLLVVEVVTYIELGLRNGPKLVIQRHDERKEIISGKDPDHKDFGKGHRPPTDGARKSSIEHDTSSPHIKVGGLTHDPEQLNANYSKFQNDNEHSLDSNNSSAFSSKPLPENITKDGPYRAINQTLSPIQERAANSTSDIFKFMSKAHPFEMWRSNASHRNGRDPRLAPLTCRIHSSCLLDDGTLLLPNTMDKHERYINGCGIKRMMFSNIEHSKYFLLSKETKHRDLFLQGILNGTSLLYGIQLGKILYHQVLSRNPRNITGFVYKCLEKDTFCDTKEQKVISVSNMTLFTDRLESLDNWSRSIIELLNKSEDGRLEVMRRGDMIPSRYRASNNIDTLKRGACFRSVITSGEKGHHLPSNVLDSSHPFFHKNGIIRDARERKSEEDMGEIVITFLQKNGNGVGAEQVDKFERLLRQRITDSSSLAVSVTSLDVVDMSEKRMREVYAQSDVLISAHIAENVNMYFMRAKSMLVEVYPFSMQEGPFNEISHQLGILHAGIVARPDRERFMTCMGNRYDSGTEEFRNMEKAWDWNVEKFGEGSKGHSLHLERRGNDWVQKFPLITKCAYEQRVELVEVEQLVRLVFDKVLVGYL